MLDKDDAECANDSGNFYFTKIITLHITFLCYFYTSPIAGTHTGIDCDNDAEMPIDLFSKKHGTSVTTFPHLCQLFQVC